YVSVVRNSMTVKTRSPKGGRGTLFILMTVKAENVYADFLKAVAKANTSLRIDKKPAPSKKAEQLLDTLAKKLKDRLAKVQDALAKEYEFAGWSAPKAAEEKKTK
ncbi:MAG: hypothetical protein P1V97_29125, partial [Planctomycetota bacterium]|nr:hypothetical protein [Planctomycetota bacterium]